MRAEYLKSENPVLSARFTRLMEDARRGALGPISSAPQMLELASVSETHTEYATIRSRMLECTDRADRARCALSMLLQSCDSFTGYLYGLGSAGCELLGVLPEGASGPELTGWLAARLQLELELPRRAGSRRPRPYPRVRRTPRLRIPRARRCAL